MTETKVRWQIEARGDVQRVGFRDLVETLGLQLGLVGTVRNDGRDARLVQIVAQGTPERLQRFVSAISGEHGIIRVETVTRVREDPEDPSLVTFSQVRGEDLKELVEIRETAVKLLSRMWETGNQTLAVGKETLAVKKETLAVGKETLAVRKETLAVGKETLSVGKETRRAVREGNARLGSKIDNVGSKVDRVAEAVRAEGRQNAEFRHELTQAVTHLDSKCGSISRSLDRIERALELRTKATLRASERQTAAILKLAGQVARVNRPSGTRSRAGRR